MKKRKEKKEPPINPYDSPEQIQRCLTCPLSPDECYGTCFGRAEAAKRAFYRRKMEERKKRK